MLMHAQGMTFGALVRELRLQRGWTQEQVARLSGITSNQVSNLEREVCVLPGVETVARLARAFGVEPGTLDPRILADRVEQEADTVTRREAIQWILDQSDRDVAAALERFKESTKRVPRRRRRR